MPAHHDVRAPDDVDLKRLGAVLAVAYERDLHDFASLLLLEKLGPRTLAIPRFDCRSSPRSAGQILGSRAFLVRPRRQGRPSISGAAQDLRRVALRVAHRSRFRQGGRSGQSWMECAAWINSSARWKSATSPKPISMRSSVTNIPSRPKLGGRTVFDDRRGVARGSSICSKNSISSETETSRSAPSPIAGSQNHPWNYYKNC
jgi:hypothetical protein